MTLFAEFGSKAQAQAYYNEQRRMGRTVSHPYYENHMWVVIVIR